MASKVPGIRVDSGRVKRASEVLGIRVASSRAVGFCWCFGLGYGDKKNETGACGKSKWALRKGWMFEAGSYVGLQNWCGL